jgi:SAM-dependent methyltransferase
MRAISLALVAGACAPAGVGAPAEPSADHRSHGHHKEHRFTNAEAWAAQFDNPTRDAWQKPDAVIAALALAPDMAVADLGAGTGYFAVRLARAVPGGTVYAEDLEPDMVRYLGERAQREGLGNLVAVRGEPDDPRLPALVDAAIMVDTYHHLGDPAGFFARLRERLRPGATVAIVDFKKDAPADAPGPPAAMRIDDTEITAALVRLGFVHLRTERELMPYQYLILMRR